jgi:SWI/SNF-related matrix-associated actin-dependent regulator 1 of chromatin subfamily A
MPSLAPAKRGAGIIAICSYNYASTNVENLRTVSWDVLILDESHYLKNPEADRTQTVLGQIAHAGDRTWALSGTPAPNNVSELWPLMYTFGLTSDGFEAFTHKHCKVTWRNNRLTILGNKDASGVRAMIGERMLRRMKYEVMPELPPLIISDFVVEPGDVNLEVHFADRDAVKELHLVRQEVANQSMLLEALGKMVDYKDRLAAVETLAGIPTSTLRRYMGLQKVPPLVDLVISELEAGAYNKLVIFAMHKAVIEELRFRLRDYGAVTLYGGTAPAARQKNIDKFQDPDSNCRVFIGQVHAAGTAISLTAAHHVLFAEYDWVPGNNAQAMMRCHRIGQGLPVNVRFAVAAGVIDEKVLYCVRRKSRELAAVFDPIDIFG